MNYKMQQADMDELLAKIKAAQSTPLIMLQCGMPQSPQEAANEAWKALGFKMGFDGMTVRPDPNGDPLSFTAAPATKAVPEVEK